MMHINSELIDPERSPILLRGDPNDDVVVSVEDPPTSIRGPAAGGLRGPSTGSLYRAGRAVARRRARDRVEHEYTTTARVPLASIEPPRRDDSTGDVVDAIPRRRHKDSAPRLMPARRWVLAAVTCGAAC